MLIVSLTEKGGESKQLTFEKEEITVGRVQGNDIVLPKGNVSKRHCRIYFEGGRFSVEDFKSTNGTYVNGRKIPEPVQVFSGDKIYVGDFIIRVENAPSAEAASLGNEAGSLSQALSGRRPPPPPARMTGARAAEPSGDLLGPEPARRNTRPPAPPPPPPPRRDSAVFPPLGGDLEGGLNGLDAGPPEPSDVDLDEEALATAPPRPSQQIPLPAPPAFRPSEPDPDSEPDLAGIASDVVTATRDRGLAGSAGAGATLSTPGDASGWLRQVLDDDAITAVFVMGAQSIELERNGRRESATLGAAETSALASTLKSFASRSGLSLDSGVVDAILPNGTRFAAVLPPVSSEVCATFRKSARAGRSFAELVSDGALSREMREILEAAVAARRNILVAGDASAAQIVLEGVANAIPSRLRVVAFGALVAAPNAGYTWTTLSPDPRNAEAFRAAAALRADYLVLDLAAVPSAADVLRECADGQQGAIVSLAGRSATDALARLEALASAGSGAPTSVRALVESTFDVVVHAIGLADGRALVLDVAEPRIEADGRLRAQSLAVFHVDGASDGKPTGRFQLTGSGSRLADTLAARGAAVSSSTLRR